MPGDKPITVQLDRARAIRWDKRARVRNSSLSRPVSFNALASPRRRLYVLCALIWSALVERDHEFEGPEDLGEYLATDQQQLDALHAVEAMIKEAFPEKKSAPNSAPSENGPKQPSSTESAPPPSTGGS